MEEGKANCYAALQGEEGAGQNFVKKCVTLNVTVERSPKGMARNIIKVHFFKIEILKNFANSTGKHLCWSFFLIKLQALRPATLPKTDSNTGVFLLNLRTF